MIIGTALRQQGKIILSKSNNAIILGKYSNHSSISPISNIFFQTVQSCTKSSHNKTIRKSHSSNSSYKPIDVHIQHYHSTTTTSATATTPKYQFSLESTVIQAIKKDLLESDKDHDGKIDAEELKHLLRKHNTKFTDAEIVELGELFYASSGAGSVSIDKFMEALDVASAAKKEGAENDIMTAGKEGEIAPFAAKGKFKTHPLGIGTCASEYMYAKTHGKYTPEELDISLTHLEPKSTLDKTAYATVKLFRFNFDFFTGWNRGTLTREKILNRAIFLETVAAIPGMVAAIIRHFRSLRNMARDGGMLNMFLEEANNERMHLLTFIRMKDPGYLFRAAVLGGQFGFGSFFLVAYMISPAFCHRFVGYVEEEACNTYTKIIEAIETADESTEAGRDLARWRTEHAPKIAKAYWHLGKDGTVLDLIKAVRADEAEHRDVNHAVSGVAYNSVNPLYDPREKLDSMLRRYVEDIMEKNSNASSKSK